MEHVRTQNWTAVAIDFVIVVVGVFMGIQVSNWNEARGDRQREAVLLQDLHADLTNDIANFDTALATTYDRILAGRFIADQINKPFLDPWLERELLPGITYTDLLADSLQQRPDHAARLERVRDNLWPTLINSISPAPSTTALNSMINAGELGIISNKRLVMSLQDYRAVTEGLVNANNFTYRPARDSAVETGQGFGLSAFGKSDEQSLITLVKNNPQLAAVCETQLGWALRQYAFFVTTRQKAAALLTAVTAELGIAPEALTHDAAGESP